MTDVTIPTTEVIGGDEQELVTYELAYHVLPTVAEGEVAGVTAELKALITQAGGAITDEEEAKRFELAYEIKKYLEGKYRRFNSAYFGWVRFTLPAGKLPVVTEEVEAHKVILRSLVIRLTKAEAENPFSFHEALVDTKLRTITDEDVLTDEVVEEETPLTVDDEVVDPVVK